MARVTVADATKSLQQIASETAKTAAGSNAVVSRTEQKALDPFLGRAADRVREAGGKGARVTVDALAAQAASDAGAAWAEVNKPGPGQRFLSQAEVQAVAKTDPALGALSKLAYLRVSQGAGGSDAKADVVQYFSQLSFESDPDTGLNAVRAGLPGATRIDARPSFPENRAGVPAGVLASFDYFYRAEDQDWAGVRLQKAKISGHDVFVVYCSTDGDDAYLEVLDKKGAPLASARLNAEKLVGWDEVFGRDRFTDSMVNLDEFATEEGLADPAAAAAAGQVPTDWTGDVTVSQGRFEYEWAQMGAIDAPQLVGSPRAELGYCALQYLWDRTLRSNTQGTSGTTDTFLFGALREGTLSLGSFTRSTDGQTYEVAKWRDKDGGGITLYFDRAEGDRLRLVSEQVDH